MPSLASDVVWQRRLEDIPSEVEDVRFPDAPSTMRQDEEWCEVVVKGKKRQIRLHDYSDVFRIRGLYEEIFYERLECCSPSYLVNLLTDIMSEYGEKPEDLRVLDVGAGNGMVGDELREVGVPMVVGIDIIPAARDSTIRDRPEVYDDYRVTDLTELPEMEEERLRRSNANCLTTVAALGFGDIPPLAFAKALDLISTPGWLAFNLKEDFLSYQDASGFSRLIRHLGRHQYIKMYCYRRYQHRVSVSGRPLYYVAVVARKLKDLDSELLDALADGTMLE